MNTSFPPANNGAVTDINRLTQLKVGKDRDSDGNIRKVAQEFESLFLNQMMKAMRSANEVFAEGNFLNSNEGKTYQDMHDQQLSLTLSQNQGIGLGDVLARQLSKSGTPPTRTNPFAQVAANPAAAASTVAESGAPRDDSALINRRRLSLPSTFSHRIQAGIAPAAGMAQTPTAGADWVAAKSFAAPKDQSLSVDGREWVAAGAASQPAKTAFSSVEDFVTTMLPMAEQAAQKIGVDARYLVAQAALETGWGKSIIKQGDGSSSHNLFGIKAHGWQGESAKVMTTEYRAGQAVKESASFRAYDSYQQSFNDYVNFLQGNGRYEKALTSTDNPEQFARELQKAGYATDPQYARKISQIARKMQTYQTVAAADGATQRT
jgi:flagellar protein FlgJ